MTFFEKRTAVRFATPGNYQARLRLDGTPAAEAQLLDIGLGGCRFTLNGDLNKNVDDPLEIEFDSLGDNSAKNCRIAHMQETDHTYGVQFLNPVVPWILQKISPKLNTIDKDTSNRARQFVNQRDLALLDIELLQSNVRGLRDKQFQMLMAGLPIFMGLLGTAFAFFPDAGGSKSVPWWVMLLPFLAVVLSFAFLAIFLQKNASIRRQDAFTHILQTHLSFGSFPPCYRGWSDAYANYNHYLRYGGSDRYSVPNVPSYTSLLRIAPSDAFSLLSIVLLVFTPLISLVLMYALFWRSNTDLLSYTVLVSTTSIGVALGYFWFLNEYRQTRMGKRSYRSLVLLLDNIARYAPPFDPTNARSLP